MHARTSVRVILALACVVTLSGVGHAAEKATKPKPDATLKLSAKAVAAGVGYSWGGGTLTYKGKSYPVTVDGITVGSVGASEIQAVGKVYHLSKLEDFSGNYTALVGGGTIGGGGGGLIMGNPAGVEVHINATTRGLSLTAGASGVKLELKK
ncbi:MAG TPA: hypothetical protein VMR50_14335 [Myxococcota bacterium]|nr:hypothetical protein [Myxococcota bacterium]